jgi:hypothetical protein
MADSAASAIHDASVIPAVTNNNNNDAAPIHNPPSSAGNSRTEDASAVSSSNARVAPTDDNPHGYPSFDIRHVPTYTNNQLRYYHISGALLNADKNILKTQMDTRKSMNEMIDWDGNTPENTRENTPDATPPTSRVPQSLSSSSIAPHTLSFEDDSEPDSDCPEAFPGSKGIKFSPSDITRLQYKSNVAQFNNWLQDLKTAFDGDPAKYPTSRQKVILASMTLDDQLQTTYNSITRAHPVIMSHWRKFKRWAQDTVLHGDSDRLKLSSEFTAARQRFNEDPNQFYLRLFNLGIQSNRKVDTEDYRTRLIKPLQTLIDQQDRTYLSIQAIVAHAGRLLQTLDHDKIRKDVKDEQGTHQRNQPDHFKHYRSNNQSHNQSNRGTDSKSHSQQRQRDNHNRQGDQRLSNDEHRYRSDNHLCFNCGRPNHSSKDCHSSFNPDRVPVTDNTTKSQPTRSRKRPFTKSQPIHVSKDRLSDHDTPTTDADTDSSDEEPKRAPKRRKN